MANELQARYQSGKTLYAVLRRGSDGQLYNGSGFEAPLAANWSSYARALTEQSTTGYYYGAMPGGLAAGLYSVDYYLRAGGSPATTDGVVAQGVIDWSGSADLGLATATVAANLTQWRGGTPNVLASGRVDAQAGAVLDKAGYSLAQVFPANFASLAVDTTGRVRLQGGLTRGSALPGFVFRMLAPNHFTGATGLTVTAQRCLDGGALVPCSNTPAEVGGGLYKIDLTAADTGAGVVALLFTAANADPCSVTLVTTT